MSVAGVRSFAADHFSRLGPNLSRALSRSYSSDPDAPDEVGRYANGGYQRSRRAFRPEPRPEPAPTPPAQVSGARDDQLAAGAREDRLEDLNPPTRERRTRSLYQGFQSRPDRLREAEERGREVDRWLVEEVAPRARNAALGAAFRLGTRQANINLRQPVTSGPGRAAAEGAVAGLAVGEVKDRIQREALLQADRDADGDGVDDRSTSSDPDGSSGSNCSHDC